MATAFDYKKAYKDLYMPSTNPDLTDVPLMRFIMVDGEGSPQGKDYQHTVELLYSLSWAIKMSKMSGKQPAGYFEYVVPPLEGLWWGQNGKFDINDHDSWCWTSMIRQPEFVTVKVFEQAKEEISKKKPALNVNRARLEELYEGWCVQAMHIGPYSTEQSTIDTIHQYLSQNNFKDMSGEERKHHEIYLSNPLKTAPEKLKTIIRLPVKREDA